MTRTSDIDKRTIRDFGEQWNRYPENDGYYASTELLRDIAGPLLRMSDIEGKQVADIGSGTGRIVNMLLSAGAGHVVAIEPSAAFEVLRRNISQPNRVTLLKIGGAELPPSSQLDLVVSIGVLHHITDPNPVVDACFRALRPGGRILVWLYGKEGNEAYLAFATFLRAITKRLPHNALTLVVWGLYPFLAGWLWLARRVPVPLQNYLNNYLARLSPAQRRLVMYDQLNPAYAKYYTAGEARTLLERAGFINVSLHHRHGYSWTVSGQRPGAALADDKSAP